MYYVQTNDYYQFEWLVWDEDTRNDLTVCKQMSSNNSFRNKVSWNELVSIYICVCVCVCIGGSSKKFSDFYRKIIIPVVSCAWSFSCMWAYKETKSNETHEVHTISFKIFFHMGILLIVHTWNSSPLRSNLLRLQCTSCTVPTTSGSPMEFLLCERVNDLRHSLFYLRNCLMTTASELRK